MKTSKKLRGVATLALLVAVPVAATAVIASLATAPKALAADHLDGPQATNDPAADITDVYGFMDGTNVILALNVSPVAMATAKFSDKVQYVLHTESSAAFGMPSQSQDIIATFGADQKIQLWIGSEFYLTGDASATTGLKSADGKVTVFAGLRDDPFFFNLDGFKDATVAVETTPGITFDAAGCPNVSAAISTILVNKLKSDPKSAGGTGPGKDFFAGLNVLSIVISIDKTMLTKGGSQLAVWGSTNKGM